MILTKLLIYFLAAYGFSFMLVYTSGPFDIFTKIRKYGGMISSKITELLSCMFCTPTWVGMFFSLINIMFIPTIPFTPGFIIFGSVSLWPAIFVMDMFATPAMVHLIDVVENYFDSKNE